MLEYIVISFPSAIKMQFSVPWLTTNYYAHSIRLKFHSERLKHPLSMELDSLEHLIIMQNFDQNASRSRYFSIRWRMWELLTQQVLLKLDFHYIINVIRMEISQLVDAI